MKTTGSGSSASSSCFAQSEIALNGYSDAINHAFAFAAKHHDRQVRKGTKLPYLTRPANVAVILTRYGQDETTVVAGILHDVVEDSVGDGFTQEMLDQRIGDKFGSEVLAVLLAVAFRRHDDDGVELSAADKKADYLSRLASASDRARWVSAADKLHNVGSILADLDRTVESETIWSRFAGGRAATVDWYRAVYNRLEETGFRGEIMKELSRATAELESRK